MDTNGKIKDFGYSAAQRKKREFHRVRKFINIQK